jgi:subtilisin
MKKIVAIVMAMFLVVSVTVAIAGNAKDTQTDSKKVKVIIGFKEKPNQADEDMIRGLGGETRYTYNIIDAKAVELPEQAIDRIKKNPRVAYVEEDGEVYALDAELDNSWGVDRIDADLVWSDNKGEGVKVAIIDTGIDYTHPELDNNYAGGIDYVNDDNDPMDDDGHGTHCAGIVAAEADGVGVVGVAPDAKLYAVKVLDADGSGYVSDVIAGIGWAVENGTDVISMSLSGRFSNIYLEEACDAAYEDGIVLVAAAGNFKAPRGNGQYAETTVEYPAAYDSVIAISATDISDTIAWFSSGGSEVELAAPGKDIYSTVLDGEYAIHSGTSMACPHVAGTAALVIASDSSLTNVVVRQRLQETADDLVSEDELDRDPLYGYGLVDAEEAVLGTET